MPKNQFDTMHDCLSILLPYFLTSTFLHTLLFIYQILSICAVCLLFKSTGHFAYASKSFTSKESKQLFLHLQLFTNIVLFGYIFLSALSSFGFLCGVSVY